MHNMPHIVSDFIKKIKNAKYVFMVYTGGGELGHGLKKDKKTIGVKKFQNPNITTRDIIEASQGL